MAPFGTNIAGHQVFGANSLHAETQHLDGGGAPGQEEDGKSLVDVPEKRGWKQFLAYLGPGFLVAIAYIDPGNFESDLQSGAQYKYSLLWVILVASCSALIIQSLSANLGVVTGKHLAEHCREEYPKAVNYVLWVVAELAIVASDIPEVIGTAYGLNMLFSIPVWVGVLLTGLSTLLLLALQQYGVRKLEILIALLVFTMAGCFLVELGYAKPDPGELFVGLFVPQLKGSGATGLAISLLGAMVMPHNLFLHSALVLSRKVPRCERGIRDGCRYYLLESGFALFLAFFINVSVIAVAGSVCGGTDLSEDNRNRCDNLDLNRASFLLRNVLGSSSSTLFAIALLASGQSSTITGTYAGQFVMQGFLNLHIKPWMRNLLTRCVAIVPSLIVAILSGSRGAGNLIIISSMILSFELPFALIPLLKFTSSVVKMGPFRNSRGIAVTTWIIGFAIMTVNIYYLSTAFGKWLINIAVHAAVKSGIGIVGFTGILLYLAGIAYLAFRTDMEGTYVLPIDDDPRVARAQEDPSIGPSEVELYGAAATLPREEVVSMQLLRDSLRSDT